MHESGSNQIFLQNVQKYQMKVIEVYDDSHVSM